MAVFRLKVTSTASAQEYKDKLRSADPTFDRVMTALENYFGTAVQGANFLSNLSLDTGGVQASGTITFSSIANNDTVTVNGRVYTAKTSGASGLQQFNIGGSDTAAATNFAAAVNADTSSLVANVVTASAAAAVTTITAVWPGVEGNGLTIAISAHGSVSGSGKLTSGAAGTYTSLSH